MHGLMQGWLIVVHSSLVYQDLLRWWLSWFEQLQKSLLVDSVFHWVAIRSKGKLYPFPF